MIRIYIICKNIQKEENTVLGTMFNKRSSCLSRSRVFHETRENMHLHKEQESIRRLLASREISKFSNNIRINDHQNPLVTQ